jgi:hypothetical protein
MAAKRRARWDEVPTETLAPEPVAQVEPAEVEHTAHVAAPDPPPAPAAPTSGLVVVRVRGPGSVYADGGLRVPGEEFVTNLTEALSAGDSVEIIG